MTQTSSKNDLFFLLTIVFLTLIAFVLLVPKISSSLFPQKRTMLLNNLIQSTIQKNNLDERGYWEFREFYSPGYFDFDRRGLPEEKVSSYEKNITIPLTDTATRSAYLHFNSPLLESVDYLTPASKLSEIFTLPTVQTIYKNDETVIYSNRDGTVSIIFLKPLSEMRRANGYFEYDGKDKELTQDKYWLNITRLKNK